MKRFNILILILFFFTSAQIQSQTEGYVPPALQSPDAWSIILFPDTQSYVKFFRNQPILDLMANWTVENRHKLNIQMVLHVGDLVEQNGILNPDGITSNQTGKSQWEAVARSMGKFDDKIAFIATTGNHDFGIENIENRKTEYQNYFHVDKNYKSQEMLRDVALDEEGMPLLTNATYEFISPDGKKFLILVLEFAPREANLQWAIETVNKQSYQDHRVILLAHSYLNSNNEHIETEGYPITDRNYGKAIWEKLVKPSKNIQMVFSGHIGEPDKFSGHVGFRTDLNAAGKKVHQMTFNAQALGGGWHGNGGDGWLRILEFQGNNILVRTFSPLFGISPSTQHLAWGKEEFGEFAFELD